MAEPTVTVFIPTFNRLHLVQAAVQSVLSQGELVRLHVLDNASSDGTAEWLKELQKSNPHVQLTLRNSNVGAFRNFVAGFEAAETPYLVPLADDDELEPGFLAAAIETAQKEPDLGAVIFVTESRRDGKSCAFSPQQVVPGRREPRAHLVEWAEKGHYSSWSSILWKTGIIRPLALSGEFERFGLPGDVWMQFLVFTQVPVFLQSKVGSIYNQHPDQHSKIVKLEVIADFGRMINEVDKTLSAARIIDPAQQDILLKHMCTHAGSYFTFLSDRMPSPPSDADVRTAIEDYISYFVPYIGFENFPLLPMFRAHRQMKETLIGLVAEVETNSHVNRSLSGRLAKRLAQVEQAVKRIVPSSAQALVKKCLNEMRRPHARQH